MTDLMFVITLLLSCWALAIGAVLVLCRMAQRGDLAAAGADQQATAPVISFPRPAPSDAQLGGASRRRQAC